MSSGSDSGQSFGEQSSFENLQYENQVAQNEIVRPFNHQFDHFSKNIHEGKQGKHIPSHNNYKEGKSILTISLDEAQDLVNKFSGHGDAVSDNKEKVNFGKIIGFYVSSDGTKEPTTMGTIHYSKDGTHIVPAIPK